MKTNTLFERFYYNWQPIKLKDVQFVEKSHKKRLLDGKVVIDKTGHMVRKKRTAKR